MFAFITYYRLNVIVSWSRQLLFFFKTLWFANSALILACLLYFIVSYSCYILWNKVCSLWSTEQIRFFFCSNINIVSSDSWMILKTSCWFCSCYGKFLTIWWRTSFILAWSWKLSNLVMLLIALFIERSCKSLFILVLVVHILSKLTLYICRARLFLNFKNSSLWFGYSIFLITFNYCLSLYLILEKCLGSFIFFIKTTFKFGWHWFTHCSMNTIIKAGYF